MLDALKARFKTAVSPWLVRGGWRPSFGIPIDPRHLRGDFGFDEEPEIKRAVARVAGHTMTSFERLASLWQQVRYLDRCGIDGALVECGVWKGGSAGMMALAHLRSSPRARRRLHLFDSFEGLPEPKRDLDGPQAAAYSGGKASGSLEPIDRCVGSLEDNKRLLEQAIGYPAPLLSYHVGWFENTVAAAAAGVGPIALLRLDGDWHDSTKVCLEGLYSRVVKGGVVVVDDYGHWEGCRKAVDAFVAALGEPVLLSHIDYTARFWLRVGR